MPKKKTKNNRLADSDEDIPSLITAEDLDSVEVESIPQKKGNKKKDKKAENILTKHIKYNIIKLYFIKEYHSIKNASRELDVLPSNIMRCCQGKYKKAYGFIWKYKEG